MAFVLTNRSLSRGEVSPYLFTRSELEDYPYSARLLDNFLISKEGVAESRPGLKHIDECRDPDTEKRLIPFTFSSSTGDTYIIEVGDEYMEFVRAEARVTETAIAITGISQGSPCVISFGGNHSWTAGDHVRVTGVGGMPEAHGRYIIETPSASSISLKNTAGTAIDSTGFPAWTSGGTVARVYKIDSPYVEADLPYLKFQQIADVIYIVHPSYEPRKLTRAGHTSWTLETVSFSPTVTGPTAVAASAGGTGDGFTCEYAVTSVSPTGREESLFGVEAAKTITAITLNNPIRVTAAGHGYTDGQEVLLSGIVGTVELNGRRFIVDQIDASNFDLVGVDGTFGYTAYSSGGSAFRTSCIITNAKKPTESIPHTITWTRATGIVKYAVYKKVSGFWGFIGYSESTSFLDTGVPPLTDQGPPLYQEEFRTSDDWPAAVGAHQGRVVYGGSNNEADTFKASAVSRYDNFSIHNPVQDTDPVESALASTEVNRIVHFVSMRRLIAMTGSSAIAIEGNQAGTLTQAEINARPYTNYGASHVRPAVVDNDILFVEARGTSIRLLFYDFGRDSYLSQDLTLKASHLFRGYHIRDMAYAKIPNSIVWVVRSDGLLLGLSFNPEVKILAWHRHTVGGDAIIEQVASIPEQDEETVGGEDAVYVLAKRTIDGRTIRSIERLKYRVVNQDARERYTWFGPDFQSEFSSLDAHVTYDGFNTGATTATLSGGTDWTEFETLTVTFSASTLLESDEGEGEDARKFDLWDSTGEKVRLTIVEYSSPTVATCMADRTVPATLRSTATTRWAAAVRKVTGLRHLEGEDVSAFGDGAVAANALTDDADDVVTVEDHAAVLSDFYATIHVGIPFIGKVKLHDVEFSEGESFYGVKKAIGAVGVYVKDSQSFYAGVEFPDEDESYTEGLYRAPDRNLDEDDPDLPIPLRTEFINVPFEPLSTDHGRAVISHLDPRPLTILSISRVVEIGG